MFLSSWVLCSVIANANFEQTVVRGLDLYYKSSFLKVVRIAPTAVLVVVVPICMTLAGA
jgi:hypothetical protein